MRGALIARGTRSESAHGGSLAACMPPRVPQPARTPHQKVGRRPGENLIVARLAMGRFLAARRSEQRGSGTALTVHTDHPDGSLPAHPRGTLRGMDAA
ncbi:hypothetical protein XarbCFBP8142_19570 [Xanthomonas arboricola]|nr:hypothetical protein XarbCFBP8142_19570 [Xanthomonas arboricola]